MKKLNNKIFLTLFTILSIFLLTVLFIFNYQDYMEERNGLINNLNRLNDNGEMFDKSDLDKDKLVNIEDIEKPDISFDHNKRFIDANIYTVVVENGNIEEIISHTTTGVVSDSVREDIENILDNNSKGNIYIGNLYTSRYSYKYFNDSIVVSDNLEINNRLRTSLKVAIIIFVLGEIICYLISLILSKRLVKPALDSFNKQKQFIADASHELKTPLSVIMASAEALEKDKDDKWLNNIKSESERMNKLITGLLDLAKLDHNVTRELETVNLSKLIEVSVLTLESLIYEKNIKLDYNIQDEIYFKCNSDEIKQVVTILLDNAIKHSIKDGKIIINLNMVSDKINLEVKNKGLPIPKGEEEKIFERFYRCDKSRNRNDNRYGLGLAIAKEIVNGHGGIIKASSTNTYTTFLVNFKLR